MARLQTFPDEHTFADNNITAAKKQIGNAVPPRLAKVFLRACVKSLEASDRAELEGQRNGSTRSSTVSPSSEEDYVIID